MSSLAPSSPSTADPIGTIQMSKNLRTFTSAVMGLDAVVRRVPADAWDNDSPCDGWTARDVLGHACAVLNAVAKIASTGEVGRPVPIDDVSDPDAVWNSCRDGLLAALDQPGVVEREGEFWFNQPTFDGLIGVVQWDPLAHSWDIATAAGIDAALDAEVAEASLAILLPMQSMLEESGRIATPVEVSADADAATRFLGAIGRNPG